MEFIDVSAKTIEDAIAKGVAQLAAEGQELVETKVLEQPSSGFLGIGRKPAVVRLFFTALAQSATAKEVANAEEQSVAIASEPVATSETEVQDIAVETSESTVEEKPSKKELSKEEKEVRKRVEKVSSIEIIAKNVDKSVGDAIREYGLCGVKIYAPSNNPWNCSPANAVTSFPNISIYGSFPPSPAPCNQITKAFFLSSSAGMNSAYV